MGIFINLIKQLDCRGDCLRRALIADNATGLLESSPSTVNFRLVGEI
jgi:hypothetical protein